jgi:hypothetical protein
MKDTPSGSYTYEQLEKEVNYLKNDMIQRFKNSKYIISEIKEINKLENSRYFIGRLIEDKFKSNIDGCSGWMNNINTILTLSINSMLFGIKSHINKFTDEEITHIIVDMIIYQLYDKNNNDSLLECLIHREYLTEDKYKKIFYYGSTIY